MFKSLIEAVKIVHMPPSSGAATTYTLAAGTTTITSAGVDCLGYDRATLLVVFGTNIAAGVDAITIEGSPDNSNWTAITGAAKTVTDVAAATVDQMVAIDFNIVAAYRYYRVVHTRSVQNIALNAQLMILSNAAYQPVTQLTTAGHFVAAPTLLSS